MSSKFSYVTYIRTSPEKLWAALTKPEFTRQYWFGVTLETDWKAGSPWKMVFPDGTVSDKGEIVESDPPRRLVLRWQHQLDPAMTAEGFTLCTFDIEAKGDSVRLSVVHEIDRDNARVIGAVSGGWPMVLAGLKSLLETGQPLDLGDRGAERAALKRAVRS
jgi:uncharacterized protein YndB with AHSA1/START domain